MKVIIKFLIFTIGGWFFVFCSKFILDIISPKSFDDLKIWLSEIKNNSSPDLKIFLLGNKNDLTEERIINKEEINSIKEEFKIDLFEETSAKDEKSAQNVFINATKYLYSDLNKSNGNEKNAKQKDCNIF